MSSQTSFLFISGFCHEINENRTLLGYYAASSGNYLPTLGNETDRLSRNAVRYYHYLLHNSSEEHTSYASPSHFVPRYLDFKIFSMEMKL